MVTAALKKTTLGVLDGAAMIFRALWFIVTTPSVWGLSLVPAFIALVLTVACGSLGIWGAVALADHVARGASGWMIAADWALRILLGAIAILVSVVVAMSLAQPLAGFALDRIAREQEKKMGLPAWPEQGVGISMWRSLQVTFTALLIGLPILAALALVTFLAPPAAVVTIPLKFIVSALMIAWDFLDYPLSARGTTVSGRLRFVMTHFSAVLGFGAAAAFVLLIPGVGLLLLPIGVAGGTRLVLEQERRLLPA
jgi:CysZ protein